MKLRGKYFKFDYNKKTTKYSKIIISFIFLLIVLVFISLVYRNNYGLDGAALILAIILIGGYICYFILSKIDKVCVRSDGIVYYPSIGSPYLERLWYKKGENEYKQSYNYEAMFTQKQLIFEIKNIKTIRIVNGVHVEIKFIKPLKVKNYLTKNRPLEKVTLGLKEPSDFAEEIKKLQKIS